MGISDILGRYRAGAPSGGEIMAGVEETLEVAAGAAAIGALEQRYGEQKTTIFMTPQTDASGAVIKDANGNTQYKSGTGIPVSAAGAVAAIAAAALVPMSSGMRRRVLNFGTGFGAAFAYRKGIEWGQKWLDSKQQTNPQTSAPLPPYAQSASAMAEQSAIQGEQSNVVSLPSRSLISQADEILAARAARAAGGR